MLQRLKQLFAYKRLKRILLIGSLTLFTVLLALFALVAATPAILSTTAVQSHLRTALTKALKRPVTWSRLAVSWSKGVELRGLSLGAGPAPLVQLGLDELILAPQVSRKDGRWRLDLALVSRNIRIEAAPGPPKLPKPYKEPLTAIAEAVQRFEKMDWPLPLDLGVTVAVEPVNIDWRDPKSSRSLKLGNLAFTLDMPSLADKPLTVQLRSDLAVDGHQFETLAFSGELKRFVTPSRRIHPASALVAVKASMPGFSLTMGGGLQEPQGFVAAGRVQLPRIMAIVGPLLPKRLPDLQGDLALDLQARVDDARNLRAAVGLNGSRLAVSGGRLKGRVGPLDLRLRQHMVSDRQKEQVRFIDGGATIGTLLSAAWEATVDRPASRNRDLRAQVGPVRVDLQRLLAAAGPLLQPRFPVRELSGEATLQRLSATLEGRSKRGAVTLEKLGISIPRFRLALAKGVVSAEGVELAIDRATAPLESRQPARVDAALSYALRRCAVGGAQPVVAEGLKGDLQLALTDLKLKSASPRKVVATVELKQALELHRVKLEKKLSAADLREQLTARVRAKESGEVEATLPALNISVAGLQASAAGRELQPLPLTAVVSASGIRLAAARGALPVVERAAITATGGDFLQLAATGALPDGFPRLVNSDGTLKADLARLLPFAAPFLPKGVAVGGTTAVTWSVAAPLKQQPLPRAKNPLARAKAGLAMAERGEIAVSLDTHAITWPLKSGTVTIADLRAPKPLRLVLPGKSGKIIVNGAVAFAGLSGVSGTARLPAQSGTLSFYGELAEWRSLKLHEELQAEPFGVVQKADIAIDRIDRLLEKQETVTAAALLQQLDAIVTADVAARFPVTPTPVPGGAELSGEAAARLKLDLAGGRDLRLRATATTRDFGVKLANGTVAEGVRADLLIDRSYTLARGKVAAWTPLSVSLVRPLAERVAAAGGAEIAARVREDLRGGESGSRKFIVKRLVARSRETTLEITALEGDLLLGTEEMGLSFFQTEVLGGTMRLRSMIDLRPEVPVVSAACSFSNLETALLLPPEARKRNAGTARETEITGELSVDAPLQTGQRELLEGVRMRLNLRKIGANTLERALFALDPDERNERIVAQRKQLRYGTLEFLRAGTLDGAFSLDGEMKIKGVAVALPKVERVRLSELPIRQQMAKTLAGIGKLRKVLDLVRADTLVVGEGGKITLSRRGQ